MRILAFLLLPVLMKSQDTIYFMNSTKELVKLIEIGPEEVRYKRTSNPDGPVFVKLKSWVHHISFENGDVQTISHESNKNSSQILSVKSKQDDLVFDKNTLYYK